MPWEPPQQQKKKTIKINKHSRFDGIEKEHFFS